MTFLPRLAFFMPDPKSSSEPSMEEIIASISRVIAEDRQSGKASTGEVRPGGNVSLAQREEGDVLELTQVVEEDGSVRRITLRTAAEPAPSDETLTASDPRAAIPTTHIEPQGYAVGEPTLGAVRERIVSTAASGAAAAAFAQLGSLPRDRRRESELPLGGAERTLEDLIREMLRPMLQSWLDEHLPGIVERLVREEIARVVGESGLR
jgi:cell pole-organizing protein PopZ